MAERAEPSDLPPGQAPRTGTGHQAELNALRWLRTHGYPDAVVVQGSAEAGVDIRGTGLAARVVVGTAAVNRADVQKLVADCGADEIALAMLTSSKYALPAVTYADAKAVMLLAYDEDGAVTPRNTVAVSLVPPKERLASRSAPASGPWVPVLRHAPLAVALYQLAFTATLVLSAARTGLPVDVGNLAFGLLVAVGLGALWFFVTRHLGRPKTAAPAEAPRPGGPAEPPDSAA